MLLKDEELGWWFAATICVLMVRAARSAASRTMDRRLERFHIDRKQKPL
jgi:hypothetical protein